jgi:hypothetical protein
MDWMTARVKSLSQNTGAYLISNGHYTEAKESDSSENATSALKEFTNDVGVPVDLKTDRAKSFSGRDCEFVKYCRKHGISQYFSEPERSNQLYRADKEIREL